MSILSVKAVFQKLKWIQHVLDFQNQSSNVWTNIPAKMPQVITQNPMKIKVACLRNIYESTVRNAFSHTHVE